MDIIEHSLEAPIESVLEQPLFCFLATLSRTGDPRISPLWYLWEDECLWILGDLHQTYTSRIERHPATAVAIVDFDPADGRVVHIGMRGTSTLEPLDESRIERKLMRYLGDDQTAWDPRFRDLDDDRWRFIRFEPSTVVARDQSFAPSLDTNP